MPTTATRSCRLYRKVEADGGIPADPGPAYTGGEYVALTAFGLWKADPPTLSPALRCSGWRTVAPYARH